MLSVKVVALIVISGRGRVIRLFHLLNKGNQVLFIICKELICCLGRISVHAFHEIPNRIHTELTFINP